MDRHDVRSGETRPTPCADRNPTSRVGRGSTVSSSFGAALARRNEQRAKRTSRVKYYSRAPDLTRSGQRLRRPSSRTGLEHTPGDHTPGLPSQHPFRRVRVRDRGPAVCDTKTTCHCERIKNRFRLRRCGRFPEIEVLFIRLANVVRNAPDFRAFRMEAQRFFIRPGAVCTQALGVQN